MLNANTSDTFSLVALELAYQRDGDVELLTAQSHGIESSEARTRQRRRFHTWNEPQFLTALQAACPPEELEAATRLYRGLAALSAEVKFGTGGNPSASFVFNAPVPPASVFSLYTIPGQGSNFAVNFDFLEGRVSDKFLEELLEKDAATSRC